MGMAPPINSGQPMQAGGRPNQISHIMSILICAVINLIMGNALFLHSPRKRREQSKYLLCDLIELRSRTRCYEDLQHLLPGLPFSLVSNVMEGEGHLLAFALARGWPPVPPAPVALGTAFVEIFG